MFHFKIHKKYVLVLLIGVFLVIGFLSVPKFFQVQEENLPEANDSVISDETIYNPVAVSEAENLEQIVQGLCDGVTILENEERICKSKEEYKQKMIGYSYESEDVVLYINTVKVMDQSVYNLDGEMLGNYSEDYLSEILEKGTTYLYRFKKVKDSFEFQTVQRMVV